MTTSVRAHARILIPISLGTALSLLGDAALYTVLPTHTAQAGVTLASVGILLSANRWIRLLSNGPTGVAYARWQRRPLFVASLFAGTISTAVYAFTNGLWRLLAGRVLWGIAWSGIWIGGNTIILDISDEEDRGRWVGLYQIAFFLGASGGAFLGGLLTDILGYRQTMMVNTALTLLGAVVALLMLPETKRNQPTTAGSIPLTTTRNREENADAGRRPLATIILLFAGNRLVIAGFLMATFSLHLSEMLGESVTVAGVSLGVTTLTGTMLGLNALVSMVAAPILGNLSDRMGDRWRTTAGGLFIGSAGFGLLALAPPLLALWGMPLTAVASGGNQGLATTLTGDQGSANRSQRLGWLFTSGDLASAAGPPIAFALLPLIGLRALYLLAGGLFLALFFMSLVQSRRQQQSVPTASHDG